MTLQSNLDHDYGFLRASYRVCHTTTVVGVKLTFNSSVPDDNSHVYANGNQLAKILGQKRHTSSIDSHERYHCRHMESSKSATELVSYQEITSFSSGQNATMEQQLRQLQQRIAILESSVKTEEEKMTLEESGINKKTRFEGDSAFDHASRNSMNQVEVLPELHEVTWIDFMNKYEDDLKEYAIEILVGEPEYKRKGFKTMIPSQSARTTKPEPDTVAATITSSSEPMTKHLAIPDRIRINSPQIRNCFATIDKSADVSAPVIMFRPFNFLVHNELTIRNFVQRLSAELTDSNLQNESSAHQGNARRLEKELDLQHMQCVLQFFDLYLKPTISRLKSDSARKVSFRDLWHIFQPGDDIFMPLKDRQHHVSLDPMTITSEMFQGRYERMWRVIGVGGGRPSLTSQDRGGNVKCNPFKVNCYYIDFDGLYFCPVIHSFSIQPYSDERDITSLEFFPLRFLKGADKLREKSKAQGKLVFNALLQSHTHFYYRGPTLTTHPCGCPLQDETLHQDNVESEVIIDYRTTLLKHPSWRPQPSFWKPPPVFPDEIDETFRVRHWNDHTRSKLIRAELDVIWRSAVDLERASIFRESARIFDLVPSGWLSNEKSVPEDDIAMLSPRVFAFVLRTRSFAPIWLWGLEKINAHTDGLRNLQLRDNSFKDTIHALVRTHFLQTNSPNGREIEYDVVRGKGKGLVFLLHGAPGVGKTFTAESVAAANGRPLFQITCGDLGLSPSEVERALQEIFRYAQQWNCVLLLDECDIFLTQRTKTDLKRNSLVSVFLRVLEWYSGVLFLTTNRVGTLDSAVKSRVTLSTYYPPLDFTQTKKIWDANLDFLKERNPDIELDRRGIVKFAKEHFEANIDKGSNWNGRQIQNAFKVAISLAGWDTLSNEEQLATDTGILDVKEARKLTVTASHFQTLAMAAEAFDGYLLEATGLTEAQRAFNAQERADAFLEEHEEHASAMLEPAPKKRRTSSKSLLVQYHGSSQLSPNVIRQPSASQGIEQPRSRRSSFQQPKTASRVRNNSSKNRNDSVLALSDHNSSVKRKHSDHVQSQHVPRSPFTGGHPTSSSSDLDAIDLDPSTEEANDDYWV